MKPEDELALSFYRELSVIKKGRISLAEHVESHRLYLKKTLSNFDEGIYQCLQRERFEHTPKVAELIRDGESLIVIEEFIGGQTLEQRLEEGCLTEEETGDIVLQLCGILLPLHEHEPKIIHRDIKPSNLILEGGHLWLIDFDAARDVRDGRPRDTVLMGTEGYAAPEQFGFGQSTERTDIYAIGVVMNRLLTGKFPADQMAEGCFEEVIRRCTALDPAGRYASVRELADAVRGRMKGGRMEDRRRSDPEPGLSGAKTDGHAGAWLLREIPGFRSGKTGTMILAGIGYLLLILLALTLEVTKRDGSPAGLAETIGNRIALLVVFIGEVFYLGNFMGFRNVFPFRRIGQPALNILRILLGAGIILVVPLIIVIMLYSY